MLSGILVNGASNFRFGDWREVQSLCNGMMEEDGRGWTAFGVPRRSSEVLMAKDSVLQSKHNVNLWMIPLQMSLGAVGLFAVTVTLDMLAAYHVIRIPDWFTMGGIDDARAILSAMLGCVSTVLALIFSVTLLVLSMVANLFGPRLLYRFVQDWVTQACIGLFMAAFIYVFLCFLVTHQDQHTAFIPQVSLITSWFLVLGAFAFLVFYSHRVAVLIQNPDAIGHIVDDLRLVANRTYHARERRGAEQDAEDARVLAVHAADCAVVPSTKSGYLQQVDEQKMANAAAEAGGTIVLAFRPGQFVLAGDALGTVSPAKRRGRNWRRRLQRVCQSGGTGC